MTRVLTPWHRLYFREHPRRLLEFRLEFKAADAWLGMFWNRSHVYYDVGDGVFTHDDHHRVDLWVCLVPMLPLHIRLLWRAW